MRLDLVVGPNGSGKSTFVRLSLQPAIPASAFVNADIIAAQRWPDDPQGHSYDAARVAAQTRAALILARRPLIAETVFSHPSKLELLESAHRNNYEIALHVLVVPEELAVQRVVRRVRAGGHSVPESKIRQRYHRLWPLVALAVARADTAVLYDNSAVSGPREAARFQSAILMGRAALPRWTPEPLVQLCSGSG